MNVVKRKRIKLMYSNTLYEDIIKALHYENYSIYLQYSEYGYFSNKNIGRKRQILYVRLLMQLTDNFDVLHEMLINHRNSLNEEKAESKNIEFINGRIDIINHVIDIIDANN